MLLYNNNTNIALKFDEPDELHILGSSLGLINKRALFQARVVSSFFSSRSARLQS
ncbi:hypothetical protein HanRHA438_Chr02g0093541 [Helianthus annuus]|nr:hypothetical protein HanRHA438_Chr02g0093541 [Helianthus annuus]